MNHHLASDTASANPDQGLFLGASYFANEANGVRVGLNPDVARVKLAADAISARLVPEKAAEVLPPSELSGALRSSLDCFRDLYAFAAEINRLPPASPSRPAEIGQVLLPLLMRTWEKTPPKGNEQLAAALYLKQHPHPQDSGRAKISYPDWLRLPSFFLQIAPACSEMPSHETYLQSSPSLRSSFEEIQVRLGEKRAKLEDLVTKEARAQERGRTMFADGIAKLKGDVADILAEIPRLFENLSDVSIDDYAPALGCLRAMVALHPAIMGRFVEYVSSIEELLKVVLVGTETGKREKFGIKVPALARGKGVGIHNDVIGMSNANLSEARRDPRLLTTIVEIYLEARGLLRNLITMAEPFPELGEAIAAGCNALQRPLTRFGEQGEKAWNSLIAIQDPALKQTILKLLADPLGRPPHKGEACSIEFKDNLAPLRWTVQNYLAADVPQEAHLFLSELKRSGRILEAICPALERAHLALQTHDFQELSRIISEEMEAACGQGEFFNLLSPILLLDGILERKEAQTKLKNQVPDIDRIKEVIAELGKIKSRVSKYVSDIGLSALKKVTPSLHDYGQDMDLSELWDVVESFQVLIDKPDILNGVAGNEGMRSGILLIGEPGVGKTHFSGCLATHLGVQKFLISPDEGEVSSQKLMIDAARKTIEKAKECAKKQCCILFIDEAELMMANREDSSTLQEQRELTTYLLQVINDIRKNHPRILICAATNYVNRIDPGMLRDGRFDVKIFMKKPGPTMREGLIRSTLTREHISLDLTDEQMAELIRTTDGFTPLTIIRTIIEPNRIGRAKAERRGESFIFDFEALKEWFQQEQKRLQASQALLEGKTNS